MKRMEGIENRLGHMKTDMEKAAHKGVVFENQVMT